MSRWDRLVVRQAVGETLGQTGAEMMKQAADETFRQTGGEMGDNPLMRLLSL